MSEHFPRPVDLRFTEQLVHRVAANIYTVRRLLEVYRGEDAAAEPEVCDSQLDPSVLAHLLGVSERSVRAGLKDGTMRDLVAEAQRRAAGPNP